jgi:23S rRNA (guanosine2251-2'-O)-methyltransferase
MLIYGLNAVREALRAQPNRIRYIALSSSQRAKMQSLVAEAKASNVAMKVLQPQQLDRMASGKVHNGVLAEVAEAEYADFDEMIGREKTTFVLILDRIQDPQNLGAILRVADGFGVDLIVLPEHDSASLTPAAVKASAGASEWIPVAEVTNLSRAIEQLKELGYWVYGADMGGDSISEIDFTGKVAIVMGNEGTGMRKNVRDHCDRIISIPTVGKLDSLNVATATAVIAYEVLRQNKVKNG